MPPTKRKSSIGRSTPAAKRQRLMRHEESDEARAKRTLQNQQRMRINRSNAAEEPEVIKKELFNRMDFIFFHSFVGTKRLHLTTNMRVYLHNNPEAEHFSKLLLDIGDGKISRRTDNEIDLPENLETFVDSIDGLLNNVYPNLHDLQEKSSDWFRQRAILATKNDTVECINNLLLDRCSGETVTYASIDTTLNNDDAVNLPTEFSNSLNLSGLPPHKLRLKLHAPIMLLRNLAASKLCNGTRLRITKLRPNIIEAEILTGCAQGEIVFIPRIPMISQDCPYEFKRLQFPVRLCLAMTIINKAQGQTLAVVGIDLRSPCFSHGQLYVACSRVGTSEGLFLLAPSRKTLNVVYPEVLRRT